MILSAKSNHKNQIWIFPLILVVFILSLSHYERFAGKRHYGDFHVYYVTGQRVLSHSEIYFEKEELLTPFKYSPLVASLFAFLALFPESIAAGVWYTLNLLLLWLCAYISWQMMMQVSSKKVIDRRKAVLTISLLCISPSILHCINSGQVGLVIAAFYYLGISFVIKERPCRSAWCFAFAAMFKYLPIMIIPYFVFRRNFKFLIYFFVALLSMHFIPAVWLGWSQNLAYLQSFIPHITATTLDHISLLDFKNQSLWAYGYRLIYFDLGFFQIADHPEWLTYMGAVFLAVLYAILVARKGSAGKLRYLVDLAALGILIVIFNPNAWKHNFVLLFLPCMLIAANAVQVLRFNIHTISLSLIALAFFCTNRSILGWGLRHDLMSLSLLPITSLFLLLSLFFIDRGHHSLLEAN